MLTILSAGAAAAAAPESNGSGALALLVVVAAIAAWIGLRGLVRNLRAGRTAAQTGGRFADYALAALANAAKLDGRVSAAEPGAIVEAMAGLGGGATLEQVQAALAEAKLTKDELVAFLATRRDAFSRAQRMQLLQALMQVFAADGRFDETEHAALVDYTEAIGFDRKTAPETLRAVAADFTRGAIT